MDALTHRYKQAVSAGVKSYDRVVCAVGWQWDGREGGGCDEMRYYHLDTEQRSALRSVCLGWGPVWSRFIHLKLSALQDSINFGGRLELTAET